MVFPAAQRSATAKTKPTVYIHIIRENDPLDKAIEKAYGENFTIVEVRNSKEFNRAVLRKAVDPHVVLSDSPQPEGNGEVLVATIVTTDGRAIEPVILKSADKRLNAAMLDAVKQFRYTPARLNGSPVSVANTITFSKETALATFSPRPRYPLPRPTGSGVALLKVDETTGRVISATMAKSTGYKILDDAALEAFRRWRFKPGTVREIRIPITFTHGRRA